MDTTGFSKLVDAKKIVHRLSEPSKMPGFSWGIDANKCVVGSMLGAVENTPCSDCYAKKGRYRFDVVKEAMRKRLEGFNDPRWVDAMVFMMSGPRVRSTGHFRWLDSGDLQSLDMLDKICQIVIRTPFLAHWLPTREYKIVRSYFLEEGRAVPKNLTVRLSAPLIDGNPPPWWKWTSSVYSEKKPAGHTCPAQQQDNECKDCRACWSAKVKHVSYPLH